MIKEIYFEDYKLNRSRISLGRTVTESDIVLHAGQSGDFFPHHMDAEWCRQQDFKKRIAHGTLIFTMGIGQSADLINPVAISYGYDRLRFIKPVYIGDTICTETVIYEKRDHHKKADMGIVCEKVEVRNQDKQVVLACDHLLYVQKKSCKN